MNDDLVAYLEKRGVTPHDVCAHIQETRAANRQRAAERKKRLRDERRFRHRTSASTGNCGGESASEHESDTESEKSSSNSDSEDEHGENDSKGMDRDEATLESMSLPELKLVIQSLLVPDMRERLEQALDIPPDPNEAPEETRDDGTKVTAESLFACPRCKGHNVSEPPVQNRAADEGMDVNCTCRDCGKRFIIRN